MRWRRLMAWAGVFLCLVGLARAAETVDLHVILPLSGNAAFVGLSQKQVLDLLAQRVNHEGGIQGRALHFVYHDDQSNPQTSVLLSGEVIGLHPPVILGSSIVAMCNAMAPLMRNGPLMLCMSPGFHPVPGGYVFTSGASTADSMRTLLRYFHDQGWRRIALITSTDATGHDADRSMEMVMAEQPDMSLVAHTHFNLTDLSVVAQVERSKEARPEAFIAWSTGTALATIFKAILQTGLDVPVGTTAGNFVYAQMAHFEGLLPPRLYVASALFPRHPGYRADPRLEEVQQAFYATLGTVKPDNMAGTSWDVAMMAVQGLQQYGPNASAAQLRDFVAGLHDWPGVDGFYDFTRVPERGLDRASTVVVKWNPQTAVFEWVSAPGGAPLSN